MIGSKMRLRWAAGDDYDVIAKIDREFGRSDGHEPHKHGTEIAEKAGQEIAGMAVKA